MIIPSYTPSYTYLWHKYRPVILRLMIASAKGPQTYRFSEHEFRRMNLKRKDGCAFILYLRKCKALNNIKSSEVANDLVAILQQSRTAIELSAESTFEFLLDKDFVLHIRKAETSPEPITDALLSQNS
jgi:hypothetical protein